MIRFLSTKRGSGSRAISPAANHSAALRVEPASQSQAKPAAVIAGDVLVVAIFLICFALQALFGGL